MRLRLFLAVCLGTFAPGTAMADDIELPPGPDRDLVYAQCRTCHDLQYLVESAGIPGDDWDVMLDSMRQYGLRLAPDIRKRVLAYLATYLGPNPPKTAPVASGEAATAAPEVDGQAVFREQCVACHRKDGKGVRGQFPPLAGNRALFTERLGPVYVVLNGLKGKIEVDGKKFNGVMPSFRHLSDAKVAAVVNYVRSAWDNQSLAPEGMAPLDAEAVKSARGQRMTPAQVRNLLTDHK